MAPPPSGRALQRRRALGQRIRDYRAARGISQEALADAAGLHRTYLGGIERGERNPSLDNIWKIADALRVDAGDLVSARG